MFSYIPAPDYPSEFYRPLQNKNPNQDATLFVKKIESKITFLTPNGTIEVDCEWRFFVKKVRGCHPTPDTVVIPQGRKLTGSPVI